MSIKVSLHKSRGWDELDDGQCLGCYLLLLGARQKAEDLNCQPRECALPLRYFLERMIGRTVLQWLMYQHHAEHIRFSTNGVEAIQADLVYFDQRSGFYLTDEGNAYAGGLVDAMWEQLLDWAPDILDETVKRLVLSPHYEKQDRIFGWGKRVLKCFRQKAGNQEIVLMAAEELKWEDWFDDPLPVKKGANSKTRLHDTIKDLNRRQSVHLVQFLGDGTGKRVGWKFR